MYKWARTSDEPWENELGLENGETQALLPAEASHSATLNGKNPFLPSTTVNTLAFVNSQEDSATDLTGGAGRRLSAKYTYTVKHASGYCSSGFSFKGSVTLSACKTFCNDDSKCKYIFLMDSKKCFSSASSKCSCYIVKSSTCSRNFHTRFRSFEKKEAPNSESEVQTDVQASKNLHAIYVQGLTSRDDATHFSTTCHNFGGFRRPGDVCTKRQWGGTSSTAFTACKSRFEALPKCKSVAGSMPGSIPAKNLYAGRSATSLGVSLYEYRPDAENLDAMTAFIVARNKFYPEEAKELFQGNDAYMAFKHYNPRSKHYKGGDHGVWRSQRKRVNDPFAAGPANPGSQVFVHEQYAVLTSELAKPDKAFCLTTLHWKEDWLAGVRSNRCRPLLFPPPPHTHIHTLL